MKILQLVRWKNLLIITIAQLLLAFFLFQHQINKIPLGIFLFIIATILNAASGYITNDIVDITTDSINKKNRVLATQLLTVQKARNIAYLFVITSVLMSFFYSFYCHHWIYLKANIVVIVLLYLYNNFLKGLPVIGNIVTAALTSLCLLLFLMFPIPISGYQIQWIYHLSIFCFLINLCREIVKDIEDYQGDKAVKCKTLPILTGIPVTKNIVLGCLTIAIGYTIYIINFNYVQTSILIFFSLILCALLYIYIEIFKASTLFHFTKISKQLKMIIAIGILSTLIL